MIRSVFSGLGRAGRGPGGSAADVWHRRAAAVPESEAAAVPRRADDGLEPFLAQIRPTSWNQPTARGCYDLLVIGGGTVGITAAEWARARGARVALASDDPLGLDGLAEGLPREVLLRVAGEACRMRGLADGAWPDARLGRLDFSAVSRELFAARQAAAAHLAAARLVAAGIDVYLGPLAFVGPAQLKVAGETVRFRRALLVPVPRTIVPPVEGLEQLGYQTPETLGMLAGLPRRWAIVGDSPAACELAQAFCRLGSAVDLIVPGPRLLAGEEPAVSELLGRQFAADGIQVHVGWSCVLAQRTGAAKSLIIEQAGQRKKLLADEILIAGERGCEVDWLRPAMAGVTLAAARGSSHPATVPVGPALQTSNARVLSIGPQITDDVTNRRHVADVARLAVHNVLGWWPRRIDGLITPRWIHTEPAICRLGRVGPGAADDHAARKTESRVLDLPAEGPGPGRIVLRVGECRRRVVGATVVGPAAAELVGPLETLLRRQQAPRVLTWLRDTACISRRAGDPSDLAVVAWLRQQFSAAQVGRHVSCAEAAGEGA